MRVGFFDHPLFREHDAGPGHPERPARLEAVASGLKAAGLWERLVHLQPREASREELLRVHSAFHVEGVAATEGRTFRYDADTQASPRSYRAALRAAGAVVEAVEAVLAGRIDRAFCAVRPPGHHAEPGRAMGFCLFNNVAVGAAAARAQGLSRVAVVDFDVHHGNGTQHAFEADPHVLYLSSHAYPLYPGTGSLLEIGVGAGEGYTVNLPLPPGAGDAAFVRAYREIALPVVRAFDPELLLVSVGFDPHQADPLAPLAVTTPGFAEVAGLCLDMAAGAAGGRAVFVLEGGYDLEAVAASAAAVVGALLGEVRVELALPPPTPGEQRMLAAFRAVHEEAWPVLRVTG